MNYHTPVLLTEAVEYLQPKAGKKYVDATLGGGGHARELIRQEASVLGIDQDQDAIDYNTQTATDGLVLVKANFSQLRQVVQEKEFFPSDGILFDLGVSSHQLDDVSRGFSFKAQAPLDMRMDQKNLSVTAADLIAALGAKELAKLFSLYGDEPKARQIASAVVEQRRRSAIVTTSDLATLVEKVYRHQRGKLHPATKVFQALRIAVNDEINNLKQAMNQAVSVLGPGGRMVVISFHEGEDRVVKHFFKDQQEAAALKIITNKPIIPSIEECRNNQRARSAKMRVAEKI